MTFELLTNNSAAAASSAPVPEADVSVRFLFKNGSSAPTDELVAFPLFGQASEVLSWAEFVKGMQAFAVGSTAQWCAVCGNSTGVCAPGEGVNATASGSGSSGGAEGEGKGSGGMSRAVAGVVGAVVALAVVLGVEALLVLVGGWRLVSRKRRAGVGGEAREVGEVGKG